MSNPNSKKQTNVAESIDSAKVSINAFTTFERALQKHAHLKSRRAFVIDRLLTNAYDINALAEEITIFFGEFTNIARNRAAISSIINDLRNDNAQVGICQINQRIVVTNYAKKSRKSRSFDSLL